MPIIRRYVAHVGPVHLDFWDENEAGVEDQCFRSGCVPDSIEATPDALECEVVDDNAFVFVEDLTPYTTEEMLSGLE